MKFVNVLKKAALTIAIVFLANPALATQAHSAPEGLYAHQLAHVFFIISMGVLAYWLRERELVRAAGWRYIQYSALFFILWNVDAFFVHLVEEQLALIEVRRIGLWEINITGPLDSPALVWLYYAAKLDHLICVPALLFLFFGLRRLLKDAETRSTRTVQP